MIHTYLRYTERGSKYIGLQPTACNDRTVSEVATGHGVELNGRVTMYCTIKQLRRLNREKSQRMSVKHRRSGPEFEPSAFEQEGLKLRRIQTKLPTSTDINQAPEVIGTDMNNGGWETDNSEEQ